MKLSAAEESYQGCVLAQGCGVRAMRKDGFELQSSCIRHSSSIGRLHLGTVEAGVRVSTGVGEH